MSKAWQRMTGLARRFGEVYRQIFHIYRAWWMYILPFAAFVLIPVEVLESVVTHRIESLPDGNFTDHYLLTFASGALTSTSLLGQVFMAGAIGLSLVHSSGGNPPRLRWLSRHISFGRLIAVDLLYLLAITIGLILLVFPGILALYLLALAGPVVEIEDRGIRGSFSRSVRLVRKDFWLVFWVLAAAQLGGFIAGSGVEQLVGSLVGENTIGEAIAKGAAEVIVEPLWAIAAVLLTMRLTGLRPPPVAAPHHEAG